MDGTILDTAEDLRLAMNHAMEATGHRHAFTREDAYFFFGSGIRVAIRRALAREAGAEREALLVIGTPAEAEPTPQELCEMQRIQDAYLPYYSAHCAEHTGPFAGIPETLRALRASGIRTAVVSNKPDAATRKLAEETFPGLFDLAAGERAGVRRKPAPDMTLTALRQLGVRPEEAVYIGDSDTDIPCMKLVNANGGYSVGVFDPETGSREKVKKMMRDNRIRYFVPADYSEGSQLDGLVRQIIRRTAANEALEAVHLRCREEAGRE